MRSSLDGGRSQEPSSSDRSVWTSRSRNSPRVYYQWFQMMHHERARCEIFYLYSNSVKDCPAVICRRSNVFGLEGAEGCSHGCSEVRRQADAAQPVEVSCPPKPAPKGQRYRPVA